MWIIKILLVISVIATRTNGLQNDLNSGYSYDRPAAIPAELAFYVNIPAGHDLASYISKTDDHFHQQHQQHQFSPSFVQHQGLSNFNNQAPQYNSVQQFNIRPNPGDNQGLIREQLSTQYGPPLPVLPFIKENSGFRPINRPHQPQINHQFNIQPPAISHQQFHQELQYQIEPRNRPQIPNFSQNSIQLHQQPNSILVNHQNHQDYRNSAFPSQELQPPTPQNIQPQTYPTQQQQQNNRFMASVSGSYNAPLPFPFGAVPIKFDPLPLKTHLRQEELLKITSYDVKRVK